MSKRAVPFFMLFVTGTAASVAVGFAVTNALTKLIRDRALFPSSVQANMPTFKTISLPEDYTKP